MNAITARQPSNVLGIPPTEAQSNTGTTSPGRPARSPMVGKPSGAVTMPTGWSNPSSSSMRFSGS